MQSREELLEGDVGRGEGQLLHMVVGGQEGEEGLQVGGRGREVVAGEVQHAQGGPGVLVLQQILGESGEPFGRETGATESELAQTGREVLHSCGDGLDAFVLHRRVRQVDAL